MPQRLPFTFSGRIVHGEKVGRTIGFPTANFDHTPNENELDTGVHLGFCHIDNKKYYCLSYFGPRFIFGEVKNCFEVYIYNFAGQLYGETLSIALTNFLRPPIKINSLEQLRQQLEEDKKTALEFLPEQSRLQ